jgi:sugar lactone lactonase YvrE
MFNIDIINSKTILGESGFYLYKSDEIVFLDVINPTIFFYSLNLRKLVKYKINLPKPLGNVYPLDNGYFLISSLAGLFYFNRRTKKLKKFIDIRKKNEINKLNYNDGTISKNKIWIGLSHIKENKDLGYFGYFYKKNFYVVDRKFKVSNGPAVDERSNSLYFSDSFKSKIYKYDLKNFKKKTLINFEKKHGFPDGLALDSEQGLWVAHWGGSKITRINLKNGKIDQEIQIPAFNVTSVTFVGKKLDHLFVTTASFELTKTQMKNFNHSGSSFIFKINYRGIKIPYSNIKYNNDI